MRSYRPTLRVQLSFLLLVCLFSRQVAHSAEKVSARTLPTTRSASIISNDIPVIQVPESVFVIDFKDRNARDPFFPNASYTRSSKNKDPRPDPKPLYDDGSLASLKLNGMGGVGDKRWAMVNGVTLYLGETAKIEIGGKSLPIECVELDAKSATIGIKGTQTRKQLKLD
jgi:hypothetical protein